MAKCRVSSSFARSISFTLCLALILSSVPSPFAKGKARAQSAQGALMRQRPPHYSLPKISELLDEGRKQHRPDLPRPALKPSTICGYRDNACKFKQTKEKKIGQSFAPSDNRRDADKVAANSPRKNERGWLSRFGRAMSQSLFNAFSFGNPASAFTANSFLSLNPERVAVNAETTTTAFVPPTFYTLTEAKLDPRYRVGAPGEDMFSGNVNYSLPLVSLPGRAGLDLNITLSYNSLVWIRYANGVSFDYDYYPTLTPGFRIGFPEVEGPLSVNSVNTFIVTLPSGRRVEMRQVSTNKYEAIDSSYLYLNVTSPSLGQMTLYTTDGTQFKFEIPPDGYQPRCTQIKDSNGNYISIAYKLIGDPEWPLQVIDKVIDTLGREIVFNYDTNLHLQSITQAWQNQTFTWAQFDYGTKYVQPNFGSLSVDGPTGADIPVITRVITGDGARHTFVYNS